MELSLAIILSLIGMWRYPLMLGFVGFLYALLSMLCIDCSQVARAALSAWSNSLVNREYVRVSLLFRWKL